MKTTSSVLRAPIQVRNLRFPTGDDVPRHWHPAGPAVTRFFDNMSIFFPDGERFFVNAVKAYRHVATDPPLAAEVHAFIGQEAMHTREHIKYNEMLARQNIPAVAMERRVRALLRSVLRTTTPRRRLAVTAALEHFTALMAHMLLDKPAILEGAHPAMASLWRWHAIEENEHKAVAFEVYKRAGGNYAERIITMIGATVIFWAKVIEHQVRLMHADGTLFNVREWGNLFRFLFVTPGALRGLVRLYFNYYRPNFHPWEIDNRELLEKWKLELDTAAYGAA